MGRSSDRVVVEEKAHIHFFPLLEGENNGTEFVFNYAMIADVTSS